MTFLFHLILLQPAGLNWEKDGKRAVSKHRRAIQGKTMQITWQTLQAKSCMCHFSI